jgi:hypothetical protein
MKSFSELRGGLPLTEDFDASRHGEVGAENATHRWHVKPSNPGSASTKYYVQKRSKAGNKPIGKPSMTFHTADAAHREAKRQADPTGGIIGRNRGPGSMSEDAMGGAVAGGEAAPTNSVTGMASMINKDGTAASPPVSKKAQKRIVAKAK